MTEEEPRVQKVLAYLESIKQYGLVRPKTIGEAIGETAEIVGQDLHRLKERGLAVAEEEGLWKITPEGTEQVRERQHKEKGKQTAKEKGKPEAKTVVEEETVVPNQADVLRYYGEKLRVGIGRGGKQEGTPLDAVIFFVQQTADLNDLNSVWNALTKMAVPGDIKKRWIELYAQSLPGKKIPEDLMERLEAGLEAEKLPTAEGKGEIAPKPKRFSVVGDQIVGDPEGDLNFNEALKLLAQQKGVPAEQASPLAAMVEAMKLGPEMATNTLSAIIPLLTKEPPKSDNSIFLQMLQQQQQTSQQQMQMLQQMILTTTEEKHKAELDALRAEIRTGQRPPESNEQIRALTQQVESLRELYHQEEIKRITEQSQRNVDLLQGEIRRMEERITAVGQGKQLDGRYMLMNKGLDTIGRELTGLRGDVKMGLETVIKSGGLPPPPRSPEERRRLSELGKQAVEKERRAEEIENKILGLS